MRKVNRFRDGLHVNRRTLGTQWPIPNNLCEVGPVHKIHREIMLALVHSHFVDGHNVRMLQARCRGGLDAKAMDEFLTRVLAEQQQFYRHGAVEAELSRLVNNAHTATGNFLHQLVVAETV